MAEIPRVTIGMEAHPLLRAVAFTTAFAQPLGMLAVPAHWPDLLQSTPEGVPLNRDEAVRAAVRDMLRHGGYKPTGRGKPASEYLVRAAEDGSLQAINTAVAACNIVSLHSGLPISVIDFGKSRAPYRIRIAGAGERYIFNAAGQEIELAGLPCLYDALGPCGNAVKDAQRTKTGEGTTETLSVVWGVAGHEARLQRAVAWYRALLGEAGAATVLAELA